MGKKGVRVRRRRRRRRLRQQEVKGPKATNAHLDGSAFKELAREGGVTSKGVWLGQECLMMSAQGDELFKKHVQSVRRNQKWNYASRWGRRLLMLLAGWPLKRKKKEEGSKTSFCVIQKVCMEYRECKKKKMEEEWNNNVKLRQMWPAGEVRTQKVIEKLFFGLSCSKHPQGMCTGVRNDRRGNTLQLIYIENRHTLIISKRCKQYTPEKIVIFQLARSQ